MRVMAKITIPVESGNQAVKDGRDRQDHAKCRGALEAGGGVFRIPGGQAGNLDGGIRHAGSIQHGPVRGSRSSWS